jgi:serine/threonine protein kinase
VSATARPTIAPGHQIGKYEILDHMATGGMAELYLARAKGIERFEKLVAIKRILPHQAGDAKYVSMLLDEARIAATLHHSNIVQVFDIGEIDGDYFYCMEYLHGSNVGALVDAAQRAGRRVSDDEAMSIILGVAAGLHYAHERTDDSGQPLGIVHRDISPTNIIVTYDGGVKLVDFGLVKATGRTTESRSGVLKGKLAYMSPEQCRGRPCDRRSDLFSLSILLWELTTGQRLFTGECDFDYLSAIVEKDIPSPSSVLPGYDPALERIVMRGLARDPAERYQTVEEMQLELEEFCRESKSRVSPITLRNMMADLFRDELAAWREARRAGVPLEDHLLGRPRALAEGSVTRSDETPIPGYRIDTTPIPAAVDRVPAPLVSPPPARRRRIGWAIAGAILIAGAAVAVTLGITHRSGTDGVTPAASAVAAPAPPPTAAPSPAPPAATPPTPTPPPVVVEPAPIIVPVIVPAETPTGPPPATRKSPVAGKTPPRPAKKPAPAGRKPGPDPDNLFPE